MTNKYGKVAHPCPAWTSPEYIFYVAHVLWALAYMYWVNLDITRRHEDALESTGRIWPGWSVLGVNSRKDCSDTQWRDFVTKLHYLASGMGIYVLGSRLLRSSSFYTPHRLLCYYCGMNIVALIVLHGYYIIFIGAILTGHYALCRLVTGTRFAVGWTWVYTIALLFLNEGYSGYSFEMFFGARFRWLDGWHGLTRWHVTFNMSVLRMISFAADFQEAASQGTTHVTYPSEECLEFNGPPYSLRVNVPRPVSEFTFVRYLAFVLYLPTYLGGPITTFNSWVSHAYIPQVTHSGWDIAKYALRLFNLFFWLELSLHFVYINAIRSLNTSVFASMTPLELASIGFYTLNFLWMKFAFIWRFCRLVALLDGVEVAENMLRCWGNNFKVTMFWKNWHASYNKWIVRYMYIPMGGSRWKFLNVFVIFGFVALWHDITMQLFQWAWIMSLFFLPEFLGDILMSSRPLRFLQDRWYYRHLRAMGGALNIILLMVANLVGYGVGTAKTGTGVAEIFTLRTLWFGLNVFAMLTSCTLIMIKIREGEEVRSAVQKDVLKKKRDLYEARREVTMTNVI